MSNLCCNIEFDVDFDRLVELRFNVNPNIRKASAAIFCIGGPYNMPHVMVQKMVAPESAYEVEVPPGDVVLRVRARGVEGQCRLFRDEEAPAKGEVVLGDLVAPARLAISTDTTRMVLRNSSRAPQLVVLEREAWPSHVVTAAMVSTLPEFRRLFSSEVLAPNMQVGIQNLVVMFTDLKGSTSFYQEVGDTAAFAVVRQHFQLLNSIVSAHDGTFVKTIGDAVMAVFLTSANAVRAALEMQRGIKAWEDPRVPHPETFIKIGIHQGPVIAVNLNDRFDYFGSTVNLAARVQFQSEGGDVVLSDAVRDDPGVSTVLQESGARTQPFVAHLSGFSGPFTLWRLEMAP